MRRLGEASFQSAVVDRRLGEKWGGRVCLSDVAKKIWGVGMKIWEAIKKMLYDLCTGVNENVGNGESVCRLPTIKEVWQAIWGLMTSMYEAVKSFYWAVCKSGAGKLNDLIGMVQTGFGNFVELLR